MKILTYSNAGNKKVGRYTVAATAGYSMDLIKLTFAPTFDHAPGDRVCVLMSKEECLELVNSLGLVASGYTNP